jgi:hypothetical protein
MFLANVVKICVTHLIAMWVILKEHLIMVYILIVTHSCRWKYLAMQILKHDVQRQGICSNMDQLLYHGLHKDKNVYHYRQWKQNILQQVKQ